MTILAKNSKKQDENKESTIDEDVKATENNQDEVENVEATKDDSDLDNSPNEAAAERDRYLRLAAEYENYRKRSTKEREMIYSDARTETINKLLPVYDNLERALKTECTDESFYKGIEMIMTQLTEVLNGMGVNEIPAVGEPFDPNFHNAVMTIENPELGENIIADEYQKGFTLGDRVIRFSTVVVANSN